MAKKLTYDKIDLMLVDGDLNARQSIRIILNNNGFRDIRLGTTLDHVKGVLAKYMPDVVLCSATLKEGGSDGFCEMMRDVRHERLGSNPFIPIIALLDEPTPDLVQHILDAGVDDIVMKPVSTAALLDRITFLIDRRKPYIVSDDYTGPVRKGDDQSVAVEVPNILQAKATGKKVGFFDLEHGIKTAKAEVAEKKLEQLGVELAALVSKLIPMLEGGKAVNEVVVGGLATLIDAAEEACVKLEGTKFGHVQELCRALIDVSKSIQEAKGEIADPRDVMLMKPLSQAVQAGFSGGISTVEMAQAIVQQIMARRG